MNAARELTLANFPDGFHEDDQLRSRFLRLLMLQQSVQAGSESGGSSSIPKVLIRFWDDVYAIPADVQECLDSWESLRSEGFDILTFDDASAAAFIATTYGPREVSAFGRCSHPAMRSDYFRLCYISAAGGFYVDADDVMTEGLWSLLYGNDCLKLQPLCYDIPSGTMLQSAELWADDLTEANRIFYVNNNPLVAPPGHPILERARERATMALLRSTTPRDIQSTTGPGNLSAALAAYAHELALSNQPWDFELLRSWDRIGETRWELSYRADERNWRNVDWS